MKILHIISSLELGGAQRLLSDMLPIMAKQHDVSLLVNVQMHNELQEKIEKAGVHIISLEKADVYSFKNIWRIAKNMRGMDVVHVHLFPSLYWVALASLFVPARLIYTEHSTSNKRRGKWYFRPVEKFIYNRYSKIVAISRPVCKALAEWIRKTPNSNKFDVVENGIDLSHFISIRDGVFNPKKIIMVSRFAKSKDHFTVIKAMQYIPADVQLIFVGDGETMPACKKLAENIGVDDRVHFVGAQSKVSSWLSESYIGVQSSHWEGFGLTAVEMMAAGLPVIASNVEGLKQVVYGAGELFTCGDERELAQIVNLLLNDEDMYKEMQQKCLSRAKLYDIHATVEAYLKIYKEVPV